MNPLHSAPDGSPVELYRRLPQRTADAELIDPLDGMIAHQRFTARELDDSRLDDLAAGAGLRATHALDDARTMIVMRPC